MQILIPEWSRDKGNFKNANIIQNTRSRETRNGVISGLYLKHKQLNKQGSYVDKLLWTILSHDN